jgi:hypothetical protein
MPQKSEPCFAQMVRWLMSLCRWLCNPRVVATNLNKGPGLIECRPVFDTVSKGPEADVGILSKVSHRVLTQPATVLVVQYLQND